MVSGETNHNRTLTKLINVSFEFISPIKYLTEQSFVFTYAFNSYTRTKNIRLLLIFILTTSLLIYYVHVNIVMFAIQRIFIYKI